MLSMVPMEDAKIEVRGPGQIERTLKLAGRGEITIGRSDENHLVLEANGVSRRHARIFLSHGCHTIEDLGSHNGTALDGRQLRSPQPLRDGSEIQISVYTLSYRGGASPGASPLLSEELSSTTRIHSARIDDLLRSSTTQAPSARSAPPHPLLAKLDRAGAALMGHAPLAELQQRIVDLAGELLEPERAALLLPERACLEDGTELKLRVAATFGTDDSERLLLSRSVIRRTMEERHAVLIADLSADPQLASQESIVLHGISSALCVPLWDDKSVIGLLYADRRRLPLPYTQEDLHLLGLIGHLAAIKISETRALDELRRGEQIREELEKAARIQAHLLPSGPLAGAGFSIAGRNVPCLGVTGDYFDYRVEAGGTLFLALGDISGKGMSAALLMSNLHAMVHSLSSSGLSLSEMAARINETVHVTMHGEQMITLFLARLILGSGRLEYLNAGHTPALRREAGGEIYELPSGAPCLGPFPDSEYRSVNTIMAPGDLLLVASDGIEEAENAAEEQFGEERIMRFLHAAAELSPAEIVDGLIAAAIAFGEPERPRDDITVIALRRG